jgi:hypothetical protein
MLLARKGEPCHRNVVHDRVVHVLAHDRPRFYYTCPSAIITIMIRAPITESTD